MSGAAEPAARLLGVQADWDGEDDDTLVCRAVRDETHDVKTFVFAPPEPRSFVFQPGQFLTFAFEIGGETIHRCYTISSAPTRPDTVSITVKRVANGPVSNWLHDTMRPGAAVTALGPMGEFSCFGAPPPPPGFAWSPSPCGGGDDAGPTASPPPQGEGDRPKGGGGGSGAPRYLFLSGGSGITPLMSMARTFHDLAVARDVVFVHAARSPADIVFRDELALMARLQPSLRLATICEADAPREAWPGHRGRISHPFLDLVAPDFRDREVFVCGPTPFMAAARAILAQSGFDMARHHEESFDFAVLSGAEKMEVVEAERALDGAVPTYTIEFAKTKRSIEVPADQFILAAARKAGIRLPSSCTKGLCGTCKSRILSGTVAMHHAGGIRQREIDAGMALLCCSKPTSDLVVER